LIERGSLRAARLGREWRVDGIDLLAFIEARKAFPRISEFVTLETKAWRRRRSLLHASTGECVDRADSQKLRARALIDFLFRPIDL